MVETAVHVGLDIFTPNVLAVFVKHCGSFLTLSKMRESFQVHLEELRNTVASHGVCSKRYLEQLQANYPPPVPACSTKSI